MVDLGKASDLEWIAYRDTCSWNKLNNHQEKPVHMVRVSDGKEKVYDTRAELLHDYHRGMYQGRTGMGVYLRSDVAKLHQDKSNPLPMGLVKQASDRISSSVQGIHPSLAAQFTNNNDHVRELNQSQGGLALITTLLDSTDGLPTLDAALDVALTATVNANSRVNLQSTVRVGNMWRVPMTGLVAHGKTFLGSWNDTEDHIGPYGFSNWVLPQTAKKYQAIRAAEHYEILTIHQNFIELWETTRDAFHVLSYQYKFAQLNVQLLKEFVFRFAS